jgi:hypothetical protein
MSSPGVSAIYGSRPAILEPHAESARAVPQNRLRAPGQLPADPSEELAGLRGSPYLVSRRCLSRPELSPRIALSCLATMPEQTRVPQEAAPPVSSREAGEHQSAPPLSGPVGDGPRAFGVPSTPVPRGRGRLDVRERTGVSRALLEGRGCAACGRPLTGRQRGACSARCRARLSRERRAAAETLRRVTEGPWRFRVEPAGRRFGWRGVIYASDRTTGFLEVHDAGFADAMRALAKRDAIAEVP